MYTILGDSGAIYSIVELSSSPHTLLIPGAGLISQYLSAKAYYSKLSRPLLFRIRAYGEDSSHQLLARYAVQTHFVNPQDSLEHNAY